MKWILTPPEGAAVLDFVLVVSIPCSLSDSRLMHSLQRSSPRYRCLVDLKSYCASDALVHRHHKLHSKPILIPIGA